MDNPAQHFLAILGRAPFQLRGHVLDAILGRLVGCTPCARVDYLGATRPSTGRGQSMESEEVGKSRAFSAPLHRTIHVCIYIYTCIYIYIYIYPRAYATVSAPSFFGVAARDLHTSRTLPSVAQIKVQLPACGAQAEAASFQGTSLKECRVLIKGTSRIQCQLTVFHSD